MGGLYSRVKTWVTLEDLTAANLNAEFDNILTNFVPLMMDDYSTNVAQMQVRTDPGELGTESLATTLAGEIARLRHMITEITGKTHWYQTPNDSLAGLSSALGTAVAANRLVSGRVRTTSDQPMALVAHGAARTVTVKGATVNFLYYVEGTQYTILTDTTLTNLTLAPSSNNTCLVNDAVAADQDWTKYSGEDGTEITIDTIGSEISSLVGKYAAFKLDNGSTTEYFIAKVESDKLTRAYRGYFFDSSDNPIPRIVFTNNDTITLMKLAWIFAKSDLTLTVTYNNPTYSEAEPSSPSIGDYWYDLDEQKWMRYDTSSFIDADATLVGVCIQDGTNCVAARTFEYFKSFSSDNTMDLVFSTNASVQSRFPGAQINVWGESFKMERNQTTWDMTLNLDSGVTESASTYYFFYVTEDGGVKISNIRPYDRREDLFGYYHPHQSWRCVGYAFNNGSSNLTHVNSYFSRYEAAKIIAPITAATNIEILNKVIPVDGSGAAVTHIVPAAALWRGSQLTFIRTDNTPANAVTLDFYGSETLLSLGTRTTFKLFLKGESVTLMSDGTNITVLNHWYYKGPIDLGAITINAVTTPPTKSVAIITDNLTAWRISGGSARLRFIHSFTTAGVGGSGEYYWVIPSATLGVVDTTVQPEFTVAAGNIGGTSGHTLQKSLIGQGHHGINGVSSNHVYAYLIDSTKITVTAGATAIGSASNGFGNANWGIAFEVIVPIVGWES